MNLCRLQHHHQVMRTWRQGTPGHKPTINLHLYMQQRVPACQACLFFSLLQQEVFLLLLLDDAIQPALA